MRHQLVHGGCVIGIHEDHFSGRVEPREDFKIGELGNELRNRIGRQPFALLVENQHGDACDRLGHRVVAEDGVLRHRRAARKVAHAVSAVVHNLAVPRQDRHGAGEFLFVDHFLDKAVQPLEPLRRESHCFRLHRRHVECRRGGLLRADCAGGHQADHSEKSNDDFLRRLHSGSFL
jgi:hypothetical protein